MELIILFLVIPALISLVAAYLISTFVRKKMDRAANKNAKIVSVLTFVASALLVFGAIFVLIINNINIGR